MELKGHSVNGREIFQDSFDLILKKSPLVEHEFEIYEQDAPAMISLTLTANHVKVYYLYLFIVDIIIVIVNINFIYILYCKKKKKKKKKKISNPPSLSSLSPHPLPHR